MALLIGIGFGFYFDWRITLVVMFILPILIFTGEIYFSFAAKQAEEHEASKLASGVFHETIINYKTVASLGHQQRLVEYCRPLLDKLVKTSPMKGFFTGCVSGFAVFMSNNADTVCFFIAAVLVKAYDLDQEKLFVALWCVLVGAFGAGQAVAYGPQEFAAWASALRIFGIIDIPSEIDASKTDSTKLQASLESFKGHIEFKNVWFRYPTRKEVWVLKNFNLQMLPNQTSALVGQSGCGKSTTVALLYRFYEP